LGSRDSPFGQIPVAPAGLYVASFGPVAAWYQIARSPALGDAIVIAYTPLAQSALSLKCNSLLIDYADLCERLILRDDYVDKSLLCGTAFVGGPTIWEGLFGPLELETPNREHADERVRQMIRDSLGNRSPEEVVELWREEWDLGDDVDLDTPYRLPGGTF
jgi:hypothetical protein